MRVWGIKLVFVAMGLILVAAGCAPEEVAPPPVQAPPVEPPPVQPPPVEPPPVQPPPVEPHEIVNLEIYMSPAGTPIYVEGIALADMLNELHPWLNASPIETLGAVDTIATTSNLPPQRRKYAVQLNSPNIQLIAAWQGDEPFKRKYTDLKVLGKHTSAGFSFASYDPEIKTPQDLVGKRISSVPPFIPYGAIGIAMLKDAWGIFDEVTLSYHRPPAFKDVLTSGVADVLGSVMASISEGGSLRAAPYGLDFMGARQTYWINVTQEDIDKVNENYPWTAFLLVGPKGCLGEDYPPRDTGCIQTWTPITVWADMDDEIAYELLKFLVDNAKEWSKRTHEEMTIEYLTDLPGITEDSFHPGALRYYEEHGIKIGA